MLDVSPTAEMVIGSLVNDVEPIVPLAVVMSVNVIELPKELHANTISRPMS